MRFTTDALVIKEMKIGERDRLVTLMTREFGVIKAYAAKPEFVTDTLSWCLRKFNFSKMKACVREGKNEQAKEICETYLKEIKENGTFSEEEYAAVEKEFREQIYIL